MKMKQMVGVVAVTWGLVCLGFVGLCATCQEANETKPITESEAYLAAQNLKDELGEVAIVEEKKASDEEIETYKERLASDPWVLALTLYEMCGTEDLAHSLKGENRKKVRETRDNPYDLRALFANNAEIRQAAIKVANDMVDSSTVTVQTVSY